MKNTKPPMSKAEAQARFLLAVLKKCMADLILTIQEESEKSRTQNPS